MTQDNPEALTSTPTHGTTPVGATPEEPTVLTHHVSFEHAWIPTYVPSWSLGLQHGKYVHAAAPYLVTVPRGPKWEGLLKSYMMFEGLSSAQPISGPLH